MIYCKKLCGSVNVRLQKCAYEQVVIDSSIYNKRYCININQNI